MKTLLLPTLLCLLVYGCTAEHAPAPDPGITVTACDTAVITSSYVLTVVATNCTNRCHKGTGSTASTNFTTYDGLKSYIVANEAIFRERVTSAEADMPPGSSPKLAQSTRDSINCWISHGMPQ
jgi:hypothetical protein